MVHLTDRPGVVMFRCDFPGCAAVEFVDWSRVLFRDVPRPIGMLNGFPVWSVGPATGEQTRPKGWTVREYRFGEGSTCPQHAGTPIPGTP